MLLAEHAATAPIEPPPIQVFATDLDEQAIATARDGFYTNADVADVSEERLQRFFMREADGYRVRRELREMVLFAQHNVIKDPPFSHLDLISCRNLLIYLNRAVQERVIETFHFALRPGGFLFLGASESPEASHDLFAVVRQGRAHLREPHGDAAGSIAARRRASRGCRRAPLARRAEPAAGRAHLAGRAAPAPARAATRRRRSSSTEEHDVVHVSERAGRYLQFAGGEPSRDLLRMVAAGAARRTCARRCIRRVRERRNVEVQGRARHARRRRRTASTSASTRCCAKRIRPAASSWSRFDEHDAVGDDDAPRRSWSAPAEPIDAAARRGARQACKAAAARPPIEQYETQAEEPRRRTKSCRR